MIKMELINEDDNDSLSSSPMNNFYRGKEVFLTGPTGAVGECMVEKLLRCNVKRLFVLSRSKKGKPALERLKTTFSTQLFDKLKTKNPNYFDKIHIIEGDLHLSDLGISLENRQLLQENVELVLHFGADVRFDVHIANIAFCNIRGTREMLNLAKEMKKLTLFTYMSTAYSNCVRTHIDEKFYPSPIDPHEMIKICGYFSTMNDNDGTTGMDLLSILTQKFIGHWPNTYSFSKAVSEELIRQDSFTENPIPIVIVRPSVVLPTHKDPFPGWCNNYHHLNGILMAVGASALRCFQVKSYSVNCFHLICVDYAVNSTLAIIWDFHQIKKEVVKDAKANTEIILPEIFNLSMDYSNNLNYILEIMRQRESEIPINKKFWHPCGVMTTCPIMVPLYTIAYQFIPNLIFDLFFQLSKSEIRVLPSIRMINYMSSTVVAFLKESFVNANKIKQLYKRLDPQDQQNFPFDVAAFDFQKYSYIYMIALKRFLKEDSSTLNKTIRKRFILQNVHRTTMILLNVFFAMLYYLYGWYLPILISLLTEIKPTLSKVGLYPGTKESLTQAREIPDEVYLNFLKESEIPLIRNGFQIPNKLNLMHGSI